MADVSSNDFPVILCERAQNDVILRERSERQDDREPALAQPELPVHVACEHYAAACCGEARQDRRARLILPAHLAGVRIGAAQRR